MVDIETTGTSPDRNAVIQIAAVKFDPYEGTVDSDFFNRCLLIPPNRFWDEDTRGWWLKKPEILRSIFARMEPAEAVLRDFYAWATAGESLCFVAKPLSFDFPFIASYFTDFGGGLRMPFDHRKGRDLRTLLAGLSFPEAPFDERTVEFIGEAHDALPDTLHQVRVCLAAIEKRKLLPCPEMRA